MLADGIAASKGVWFANEPYAVLPTHPAYELKKQLLPQARHSHFFGLRGEQLEKFSSYTNMLLNAELRGIGTCRNTRFPLRADRVCLKILNAPWMIDWFCKATSAEIIALIRHPAAQALSVLRLGWGFPLEAYVERKSELESYFTSHQIDFMCRVIRGGDKWEIALVDWAVTSFPLRKMGSPSSIRVRYEDIVENPGIFVDEVLIKRLKLSEPDYLLNHITKPSGSSKMSAASTNEAILKGRKTELIHAWNSAISDEMRSKGAKIVDVFEVEEYSFSNQPENDRR